MTTFTTINDVINHADGMIGYTTESETRRIAEYISKKAHDSGLLYGDDWSDLLEDLTMDELINAAELEEGVER